MQAYRTGGRLGQGSELGRRPLGDRSCFGQRTNGWHTLRGPGNRRAPGNTPCWLGAATVSATAATNVIASSVVMIPKIKSGMRGLKYIQALPSREEQESPKAGQAELPVRQGVVLSVLDWRLRAGDTLLRGAPQLSPPAPQVRSSRDGQAPPGPWAERRVRAPMLRGPVPARQRELVSKPA